MSERKPHAAGVEIVSIDANSDAEVSDWLVDSRTGERMRVTSVASMSMWMDEEGRVFRSEDGGPEREVTDSEEGISFLACFPNWALDVIGAPRDEERQRAVDRRREEIVTGAFCFCDETDSEGGFVPREERDER